MVNAISSIGAIFLIACLYCVYLLIRVIQAEKSSFGVINSLKMNANSYVIVMGAAAGPNGPSAELEARLNMCVILDKLITPQKIFLYGGHDQVDETHTMKQYLITAGISEKKIFTDSRGENTRKSLELFSKEILEFPREQIVVVSSGYHALRLAKTARKLKIRVIAACPPTSPETQNRHIRNIRLASEVLAIIWYTVPRRISDRLDTSPDSFRHRIPQKLINLRIQKQRRN